MVSRFMVLALSIVLLAFAPTSIEAGGEKLGNNSIVVFSVDDWQAELDQSKSSDFFKFLEEPSVQAIAERLVDGFGSMLSSEMDVDQEAQDDLQMVWDHLARARNEMTGEFVMGVGYRMDPNMGMPMPDLIIDFHGPVDFTEAHQEILTTVRELASGAGGEQVPLRTFSIGDMEFSGIEGMPGVGFFIGHFEGHHMIGTNKASMESYLAEGDTAVGDRFSSTRIHQLATKHLKRGSSQFFFNMDPIWNLTPMLDMFLSSPDAGGFDEEGVEDIQDGLQPSRIIGALGLDSMSGFSYRTYYAEGGYGVDGILGIEGRPGLMALLPQSNTDISVPDFVPDNCSALSIFNLEISKIFDIVISIGSVIGETDPEEMAAEIEAGLEMMKMQTGVDLMELVDSLTGTICSFTKVEDSDSPANPMAIMMGGAQIPFVIGAKIDDRKPWEKMLESMGNPEMMGAALKKEEFLGRDLYSFNPLGDVPPEFAGQGPSVVPALCLEGDWLIFANAIEDVQAAIRVIDGEGEERFGSGERTSKILSRVKATQGVSLGLTDMGANLSQAADILRPLLGLIPLMAPELAQEESMLFLFDPENIPESELLRKYFGWTAARSSVVEGGIRSYNFMEQVTRSSDAEEKKEEDPRGSQL